MSIVFPVGAVTYSVRPSGVTSKSPNTLVVSVARGWEAADQARLKKKIGRYLEFVADDGLADRAEDWHQGPTRIAIHAAELELERMPILRLIMSFRTFSASEDAMREETRSKALVNFMVEF